MTKMYICLDGEKQMIEYDPNHIETIEGFNERRGEGNLKALLVPLDVTITFKTSPEVEQAAKAIRESMEKEQASAKLRNHKKREWRSNVNKN